MSWHKRCRILVWSLCILLEPGQCLHGPNIGARLQLFCHFETHLIRQSRPKGSSVFPTLPKHNSSVQWHHFSFSFGGGETRVMVFVRLEGVLQGGFKPPSPKALGTRNSSPLSKEDTRHCKEQKEIHQRCKTTNTPDPIYPRNSIRPKAPLPKVAPRHWSFQLFPPLLPEASQPQQRYREHRPSASTRLDALTSEEICLRGGVLMWPASGRCEATFGMKHSCE